MEKRKIPLYKVYWDTDDINYVIDTIKRGSYWALGPNIKAFEEELANYVGSRYALTFNSGTSALHATMLGLEIKKDHEVIVPSFTFIATANAVLYVEAKPVFAEIEEETYGLDPEDVINKINSRTKAIIPIHYGGGASKIKALKDIAEDFNLYLVEDAAESLGTIIYSRKVGTFGNIAIFSFCGNKVITTGEGGAIVTDDPNLYKKLKLIRSHGRLDYADEYFQSTKNFDYVLLGYNWRISDITAALGRAQLKKIEKIIEMRRKNASLYAKFFKKYGLRDLVILPKDPPAGRHIYQMYTIRFPNFERKMRDELRDYLNKWGITTKIYFEPIHLTTLYKKLGFKKGDLPRTESISEQVLTLPMYPQLTADDIEYIVSKIREFIDRTNL